MKHLAALLLCLTLAACKKQEDYDFVVICRVPVKYSGGVDAKLIVTDIQGNRLKVFAIPNGETEIYRKFEVSVENPLEVCNIHFAFRSTYDSPYYEIFSHLEVQNAALVVFDPAHVIFPSLLIDQKVLRVNGIESLDSLGFFGEFPFYHPPHLDPVEKRALVSAHFWQNQGAVLQGKANNAPDYRYLYLSDSIVNLIDWSHDVEWSDFKPAPVATEVKLPVTIPPARSLAVDAISPDFARYVSIGPGDKIVPASPRFIRPEEAPKTLRIRVNGDGYAMERIFKEGETLEFGTHDMKINSAVSTPGVRLQIDATGDVDLLEAVCFEPGSFTWIIQGKPSSFKTLSLPDLSEYLPTFDNFPPAFEHFTVTAHQYGKQDYPQVREGFPYRSGELFSVARSGYYMIEKSF